MQEATSSSSSKSPPSDVSAADVSGADVSGAEERIEFGSAFRSLHGSSYPLLTIFLCAPFIQPVSLGPLATVGGLALTGLGYQLMRGRETPWLPQRIETLTMSAVTWNQIQGVVERVMRFLKKITAPRLPSLIAGERGHRNAGFLIMLAGLLMAIPFIGIPFNNSLPAFMALCAAFALLEDDGLFVIFSVFWLFVTLAYFTFIFWAIYTLGMEAVIPYIEKLVGL